MRDHELRRRAVGEMHLRRWPLLPVPCHIVQWVLAIDDAERAEELHAIELKAGGADLVGNPAHREGRVNDRVTFTWERQSEGSSLTLYTSPCDETGFLDPMVDGHISQAIAWAQTLPGQVIRSTRIWLGEDDADVQRVLDRHSLNRDELVSSTVGGGIRVWSDFRIMDDGFGRLFVAANGADRRDLTRQLQRMQELGNYRNKALLGLPVARESWPKLDAAEERLRDLSNRIANSDARDDSLLEELSGLALDLASVSTAISFRMDATRAYGQIVEERLEQLEVKPVEGFASLVDFTQRRFRPAMNTCLATNERIERIAHRTEQLASLLRARIDTRIENQNAELLRSMEQSISMQARLQQLVEGLSAVALSYYVLGLIKYALYAVPDDVLGVSDEFVVGLLVLPLVLGVWWTMHVLKDRLIKTSEQK
ncbi:DUF3422 domain-containing protein [Novosphingobium taihuense]|uniref:Putative membrane-anchored protein n=1 Tax=Novosphingobium taihuense TaxID=260085 RepID=A0A7W7ESU4_9SPHN|nr:DUF3422 domain-containing protein [Novosphingobium taihuense]MBB4612319.1 putative membrane-anchored protein [Novosphingobium taihuense]TWH88328.1 putative membrane-anchored protein [Novosphingobium taihuense]